MKIAVTSTGSGLDAQVDPRFGRCAMFVVVDTDSMDAKDQPNQARSAVGGAGIQAGQDVASLGVDAVITGNVGPNAARVLSASGVKIYIGASGTVKDSVEAFKSGKLSETATASVQAHTGMGGNR